MPEFHQIGDVEIDPRDPPFIAPADKVIAIDLPVPLSVNRTRRVNWAAKGEINAWLRRADMMVMAAGGVRKLGRISGKFEIKVTLDESANIDIDNGVKLLVDYCRRIEIIRDDSKKFMRRVVLEWGPVTAGCRVTLREVA